MVICRLVRCVRKQRLCVVMSTCKMCQVNELVLYLLKAKVVCGDVDL